jgi:uncharacterized membrane protein
MLPLLGVAFVVLGFAARVNPLLVVMGAAVVSGLAGGLDLTGVLSAFGKAFNENRYISVVWLILPAIGALERAGLQQRVKDLIAGLRAMTLFRLLTLYFLIRQAGAALGLASVGGPATLVRPLMAPMAEATAEARLGPLPKHVGERIRAQVAATDNVAVFFGEDIFVAIGSILLIKGVLQQNGIIVEPLQLSVWAIPTAVAAFAIHATRLFLFERRLSRQASVPATEKTRA